MDGIIALGHFCETHGPCIILSTQRYLEEPQQKPHSLIVQWCEACQSLQPDQAFLSRDSSYCYITTRTPLSQEDAFLLRQAAVRSLSCEQEGTLYFGDDERGHVFSHTLNVHDTLARGFQRKYCIMVIMRDKLTLLNGWSVMSEHIRDIATYITECSEKISKQEQVDKSQKSQRQSEGSPSNILRSLTELTKPTIYSQLHLWFAWVLGCPITVEKCSYNPSLNVPAASAYLRVLYQEMGEVFSQAFMLHLHGYEIQCKEETVLDAFNSIWPPDSNFIKFTKKQTTTLLKSNTWLIETKEDLSQPKSRLQRDLETLFADARVSESTLIVQIGALVMPWIHNANVLLACPHTDINLLNSMNITKNDICLLAFIMSSHSRCEQIVANMRSIFNK